MTRRTAILGAGITGLELGRRLEEAGRDFVILEKEPAVGGLCRTLATGAYRWDFGVHAMYSRSAAATERFLRMPLDYQHSVRDVRILSTRGRKTRYFVNYPFENGVHELPPAARLECVLGYLWVRARRRPTHNLREWIDDGLGFGIAKHFMLPYNRKIWNCDLSHISKDLVNTKIEPAGTAEFLKGALRGGTVGREYQSKFLYPRGGIQALPDHLASGIRHRIRLSSPVERLERREGGWKITAGGHTYEAGLLVSTIPLPELLRMLDLEGVPKSCPELVWNDTFFVLVGLKPHTRLGAVDRCHWVFFPGDEIYYRVTLMHNFSDALPPALIAEVTAKNGAGPAEEGRVVGRVVNDLIRTGLIADRSRIAVTDIRRADYTYPIPTVGLPELKRSLRAKLESHGIFLAGRNGDWNYLNIDGALLAAESLANTRFCGAGR